MPETALRAYLTEIDDLIEHGRVGVARLFDMQFEPAKDLPDPFFGNTQGFADFGKGGELWETGQCDRGAESRRDRRRQDAAFGIRPHRTIPARRRSAAIAGGKCRRSACRTARSGRR